MTTLSRNLLENIRMPHLSINIPFAEKSVNGGRFLMENGNRNKRWDVEPNGRCNEILIEELFNDFFRDITVPAVIYVSCHIGRDMHQLVYKVSYVSKNKRAEQKEYQKTSYISAEKLAIWFAAAIPIEKRRQIKFHLISCYSANYFAPIFLEKLQNLSFRHSFVVGYSHQICYETAKLAGGPYSFGNLYGQKEARYGDHSLDETHKYLYHNLLGKVTKEDYRAFKQKYGFNVPVFAEYAVSWRNLQLLCQKLIVCLQEYVDENGRIGQSKYTFHFHKHSSSGRQRALLLSEKIQELLDYSNQLNVGDIFSIQLCSERVIALVQEFSKKEGDFGGIDGKIRVNKHSCMSFIIKAIGDYSSLYISEGNNSKIGIFLTYLFKGKPLEGDIPWTKVRYTNIRNRIRQFDIK